MIELLTYVFVGAIVSYGVFTILMELSSEIKYMRIEGERDTDERQVAGEDTSEVALNYLKAAARLENDDEVS